MTSQWPSVFSLFKRLSLSCPPPPQPSEISWHPRVPAAVSHTNISDVGPFVSPSGVIWGRNGEEVHWKMERKRKEVDGARNKRRPKICFGVCGAWMFFFFSTNSSSPALPPISPTPPPLFSWRQLIDFILGLSYHLAAFHSSVFIKQGEHRETEQKKKKRSKKSGQKIHYVLNKGSERGREAYTV